MAMEPKLELEECIQALLCGALDGPQRDELLLRIARDDQARELLEELLVFQQDAREALGYHGPTNCPPDLVSRACRPAEPGKGPSGKRSPGRRPRTAVWIWRVAASVVLTASLLGAAFAYVSSRDTRNRLAEVDRHLELVQVTAGEIASYQRVWREIVAPADKQKPWILLSDNGGRFEYLPAENGDGGDGRFTVLRCMMISTDGAVREEVSLLLPAGRRWPSRRHRDGNGTETRT